MGSRSLTVTVPAGTLSAVSGRANRVSRFVYAIGGDEGEAYGALSSVEAAPVGLYRFVGAFRP